MNNFDIMPTQNKQKRPNNRALVWIFYTLKETFFFFFSSFVCVCLVFHFERGHLIIWSASVDTPDKRTNTPNKSADTQHLGAYGLKCFDIHVITPIKSTKGNMVSKYNQFYWPLQYVYDDIFIHGVKLSARLSINMARITCKLLQLRKFIEQLGIGISLILHSNAL